jgi:hypothetical protein
MQPIPEKISADLRECACRQFSACMTSASLAVAIVLSGCASSSSFGPQRSVAASPGFKGKQCEMVSPEVDPNMMRPGKPATVKARAHFVGGEVRSVQILSGPAAYRQPVIDAMKQYTCAGGLTFVADQKFVFGVDPLSGRLGR